MSQVVRVRQGRIRGKGWDFRGFSGFGAGGLAGRLGMLKPSPINTGAAAAERLQRALGWGLVPGYLGDSL